MTYYLTNRDINSYYDVISGKIESNLAYPFLKKGNVIKGEEKTISNGSKLIKK